MKSRASLIAGYDHTSTSFLHKHKSRKTNQKTNTVSDKQPIVPWIQSVVSISRSKNSLKNKNLREITV